jgi:hypothetical protein
MAELFTIRWATGMGEALTSRTRDSESAALALAFEQIRAGRESVMVRRPDRTELEHDTLLMMMAAGAEAARDSG